MLMVSDSVKVAQSSAGLAVAVKGFGIDLMFTGCVRDPFKQPSVVTLCWGESPDHTKDFPRRHGEGLRTSDEITHACCLVHCPSGEGSTARDQSARLVSLQLRTKLPNLGTILFMHHCSSQQDIMAAFDRSSQQDKHGPREFAKHSAPGRKNKGR